MRRKAAAALLAALLGALLEASPAAAGGWAVTVLDPLPGPVESGRTYTVTYWLLQHAAHPPMIPISRTALQFVDASGSSIEFPGRRLADGHYTAAVSIPHDGRWRVIGVQEPFLPYEVGTLSVPGGVFLNPTPQPLIDGDEHANNPWPEVNPGPQPALTRSVAAAHRRTAMHARPSLLQSALFGWFWLFWRAA